MNRARRYWLGLVAVGLAAAADCGRAVQREPDVAGASLVLEPSAGWDAPWSSARFSPAGIVTRADVVGSRLVVRLDLAPHTNALGAVLRARTLRAEVDGACPVTIDLGERGGGAVMRREVRPMLDFGGPYAEVGFDRPVTIAVRPGCPEARAGAIRWTQREGKPLRDLRASDSGFRVEGRTATLTEVLGRPPSWGLVPIAPRTRGEVVLDAAWTPASGDAGQAIHQEVRLEAAARCRGLPNLAVGTRAWLGGEGWHVVERPEHDASAVRDEGPSLASFEAASTGRFVLADRGGRSLAVRAARYDETPLDCGRATCHTSIAEGAALSPMTAVLATDFARMRAPGALAGSVQCALACHATGEPGIDDGGFTDVARVLAFPVASAHGWEDLPVPLRRLGGVGCLACHGPGAIAEPGDRWTLLRNDVCAYCHDAPPRYEHVATWKTTAMAHADESPGVLGDPACRRCHTTSGFLAGRAAHDDARVSPAPLGITCAACHAVHASGGEHGSGSARSGAPRALLRGVEVPRALATVALTASTRARTSICFGCHAPAEAPEERKGAPSAIAPEAPEATAALIWAGRGGVEPLTGAALPGEAPHAAIDGGCVGCHGPGHDFRASARACGACHQGEPRREDLRTRARAAFAALTQSPVGDGAPPHAARVTAGPGRTPASRAAFDLLLVLEDRAANVHNLPYARALVERAERVIETLAQHPARRP